MKEARMMMPSTVKKKKKKIFLNDDALTQKEWKLLNAASSVKPWFFPRWLSLPHTYGWPKFAPAVFSLLLSKSKANPPKTKQTSIPYYSRTPTQSSPMVKKELWIWVISKNSRKARQKVKRGEKKSLLWIQLFQTQSWGKNGPTQIPKSSATMMTF